MTMRELVASLRAIRLRRDEEARFQAAIHGVKLNPAALSAPDTTEPEFTPDEDAKAEQLMQALIAKKKAQHQGKPIGG
jgi:hypothetical protein